MYTCRRFVTFTILVFYVLKRILHTCNKCCILSFQILRDNTSPEKVLEPEPEKESPEPSDPVLEDMVGEGEMESLIRRYSILILRKK